MIAPLVSRSGGAGLLWRRVGRVPGAERIDAVDALRQTFRQQVLDEGLRVRELERILVDLAAVGVRPLLIKGWSVARRYPERGLRPFGDLDLVVPADRIEAARAALSRPEVDVDLHGALVYLDDRSEPDVRARVQAAPLGRVEVDLLGDEDQLRLLALHLLVHGAWRTVWLCDLALLVETRRPGFDWDYFLAGDRRRTEAVVCALGLARAVLGAALDETPIAERARRLPRWLVPSLLRQWGRGFEPHERIGRVPRSPRAFLAEAARRWNNPIAATAAFGGPYDDWPRLPFQVADYLVRTARFLRGK